MAGASRKITGAKSSSIKSLKIRIPEDWEKTLENAVDDYKDTLKGQMWSDEQIATVKKYYDKVPGPLLAKTMNVTLGRLKYKIDKMVARGELKSLKRKEV